MKNAKYIITAAFAGCMALSAGTVVEVQKAVYNWPEEIDGQKIKADTQIDVSVLMAVAKSVKLGELGKTYGEGIFAEVNLAAASNQNITAPKYDARYANAWSNEVNRLKATVAASCPGYVEIAEKYGSESLRDVKNIQDLLKAADGLGKVSTCSYEDFTMTFTRLIPRVIRKKVVIDDGNGVVSGKAAIERHAKAMEDAINAPYFSGLEVALKNVGITAKVSLPNVVKQQDLEDYKFRVLVGDLDISRGDVRTVLQVALGNEGYNAFVDRYNDGVSAEPRTAPAKVDMETEEE